MIIKNPTEVGFFITFLNGMLIDLLQETKINHMQKLLSKQFYVSLFSVLMLCLVQAVLFAQDSASTSSSSSTTTSSTTVPSTSSIQPWMWVVGGAVLLIIIIALLRSGGSSTTSSEKVTVTKEVE